MQVKPLRLVSLKGESTQGGTVVSIFKETILCIIVLVRDSGKLANLLTESSIVQIIMPNFQIEPSAQSGQYIRRFVCTGLVTLLCLRGRDHGRDQAGLVTVIRDILYIFNLQVNACATSESSSRFLF